jgi:hypothetical protein
MPRNAKSLRNARFGSFGPFAALWLDVGCAPDSRHESEHRNRSKSAMSDQSAPQQNRMLGSRGFVSEIVDLRRLSPPPRMSPRPNRSG